MDFFVTLLMSLRPLGSNLLVSMEYACQIPQCSFCISLTAIAFSDFGCKVKRRENPKVGLHGLKVFEVSMRDIMTQRTQHGGLRKCNKFFAMQQPRCVDTRQQTGSDVAHVALHAGDLTREEEVVAGDVLQCRT